MATSRICGVQGCDKPHLARNMCQMHYSRHRNHGSVNGQSGTFKGEPQRFFRDVVIPYRGSDCLPWPYNRNRQGYGYLHRDGRDQGVHRLVCHEVNGPPPSPQHFAIHSCGNGHQGCCAPNHLRWGTQVENMADTLLHDTHHRGERTWNAKLSEEDVIQMRSMWPKTSYRKIAKAFGVSYSTVREAITKKTWYWLD